MTVADGGVPPLPASAPAASAEVVRMRAAGLAEMELFADCSAEQLHAVAQRLRPLRAAAGQTLMKQGDEALSFICLLYTSPSPRDGATSRMPSSA